MSPTKKVKKKKPKAISAKKAYDFSTPHEYYMCAFGMADDSINMFVVNMSVGNLLQDFKIFEDLNNVQNWPISTLIQRELDHKRASLICKDYLLKEGDTKYFPPLIAVLIPTDEEYKPLEKFPAPSVEEVEEINTKFIKGEENYSGYDSPEALSGGIVKIPFGEIDGDLVWDKNTVSAVIIDGQHRYKALQEAVKADKKFFDCKVTVTLVDLVDICGKTDKTPTDVARDLFVTINNTPIEVDETRLVLMDDKDVLSTFTQTLIDDSADVRPSISPELIDWECEGAKHDISCSVSGVLVLRQIILSAMFDDSKVSTVEDRTNVRNVKKWKGKIDDLLSPDGIIEAALGSEETIAQRFKVAEEDIKDNTDDEEEESIFLFSFSTAVSKILKERFKELLQPCFSEAFANLSPYSRLVELAKGYGVLDEGKQLNNYYRAFKGKRENLKKEVEIKKAITAYEKEFLQITDKSIPHTVMGQKSIFKALFDGFLNGAEERSSDVYLELTKEFVEGFNDMYAKLCPSMNSDENLFLTDYKMKKNKISKAKSVGSELWKGIIIKFNGEIDYSKSAVVILSQIIQDLIFYLSYEDDSEEEGDEGNKEFEFTDYTKLVYRHQRLLKKLEFEDDPSDEELRELAESVVKNKQKELERLLNK